ncbi:MAG: hypothetical protein HDR01_12820 [Lachnospiraceae bacterium]|nr:hypothetical protein [Lachnospiraceae bacterium]
MEKRKKIFKFLIAMLLGIFWCIVGSIFNLLFYGATIYPYIFPYETFLLEVYFMVMIIYYFHKVTNKMWVNYLESGFLTVFCIVEGWLLYKDIQEFGHMVFFEYRFMPIGIVAVFISFFLYKWKKGQVILYKIEKMNNSIFIILLGFFCYLGFNVVVWFFIFDYQLGLKILSVFVALYIIIAQKILKGEYRWKLLRACILVFAILFLKVCLMQISDIVFYGYWDFEDFLMPVIPYGIAVAIGELIAWLWDKRKDSRLAKQEAEDMESDWYLRF